MTAFNFTQPTDPAQTDNVLFDVQHAVAIITLNDPTSLNALHSDMIAELSAALDKALYDAQVKVIVLTGVGRAFCSGGDIREMVAALDTPQDSAHMAYSLADGLGEVVRKIRKINKPIIARINGTAAGAGMNIALACDFRVASDDAKFLQAFVNIGLVPDAGGIYLLTQLIGAAKTTQLVMLGELLDAKTAQDLGLLHRLVPADALDATVTQLTKRLCALPTLALAAIKQSINQVAYTGLAAALEQETIYQAQMAQTQDFQEGVRAFLQKRPAQFVGR